jgi:hypothetical protein
MSQENVEIAACWYEVATSKAELLAAMPRTMAFCHPEVEWTVPEDGTTRTWRLARRPKPLGIWRISASFSQERRYALTRDAKSLRDCLHSHPLLVEGEGLCLTDASTESIEHLLALRDELDEQRCPCGFNNLRIRQPV